MILFLSLILGIFLVQIMILKHAQQSSFVDPFLSLIISFLVQVQYHLFFLWIVTSFQVRAAHSSSPVRAVSPAWAEGPTAEGGGSHGWHVCVFYLALDSFYYVHGVSSVRQPNIQPTTNHLAT
jgi:hypothetical protein